MNNHVMTIKSAGAILLSLMLAACITGNTVEQKRAAVQDMRNEVLNELYVRKPDVRDQVATAVGYAVFSNANASGV